MFKLLAITDPDEPETETPPPTGATVKKTATPQPGIALFGFRALDDTETQCDSEATVPDDEGDSKVA